MAVALNTVSVKVKTWAVYVCHVFIVDKSCVRQIWYDFCPSGKIRELKVTYGNAREMEWLGKSRVNERKMCDTRSKATNAIWQFFLLDTLMFFVLCLICISCLFACLPHAGERDYHLMFN